MGLLLQCRRNDDASDFVDRPIASLDDPDTGPWLVGRRRWVKKQPPVRWYIEFDNQVGQSQTAASPRHGRRVHRAPRFALPGSRATGEILHSRTGIGECPKGDLMRSLTRLTFGMVVDRRPSPGHELGKLKLLIFRGNRALRMALRRRR